jgi:hypothetical protein
MPVMLLCLVLHAFFVSVTHFHYSAQSEGAPAQSSIRACEGHSEHNAPGAGGHSNCLSCRLQRNFVSDLTPSSIILEQSSGLAVSEPMLSEAHSHGPFLVLSDRAPPSV